MPAPRPGTLICEECECQVEGADSGTSSENEDASDAHSTTDGYNSA